MVYSAGKAGQETKMILENSGDLERTFVGHGKRSGLFRKDIKWKILNTCMTTADLFLRLPSRVWKQTDGRDGHCRTGWGSPSEEGNAVNQAALLKMERVWSQDSPLEAEG